MKITKDVKHTTGITYYLRDGNISYQVTTFSDDLDIRVSRLLNKNHMLNLDDDILIDTSHNKEIIFSTY